LPCIALRDFDSGLFLATEAQIFAGPATSK
jgi:hypothetical protein